MLLRHNKRVHRLDSNYRIKKVLDDGERLAIDIMSHGKLI